jgi:transposase
MTTCSNERVLRRPRKEDSLRRGTRDVQGPGSPYTFDVSLSSVKRYVNKAGRGESLVPKKSPGSAPKLDDKARKLLEDDLTERPYATLQQRRDYIETITGLSVSRSTVCRAIGRRIGSTRKKGDE